MLYIYSLYDLYIIWFIYYILYSRWNCTLGLGLLIHVSHFGLRYMIYEHWWQDMPLDFNNRCFSVKTSAILITFPVLRNPYLCDYWKEKNIFLQKEVWGNRHHLYHLIPRMRACELLSTRYPPRIWGFSPHDSRSRESELES